MVDKKYKEREEKNQEDFFEFNINDSTGNVREIKFNPSSLKSAYKRFEESESLKEEMIDIEENATGSIDFYKSSKIIDYPFEHFNIKVELSEDNKFLGIKEIEIDKDFRNLQNKLRNIKVHNIMEFDIEE